MVFLRDFRDEILRKTRSGAAIYDRFYDQYYRVSPAIADLMRRDQDLRDVFRWSLVTPLLSYFRLALRFPTANVDAEIEAMPEPWKSFLTELREDLERWAASIELPLDFRDLSAVEAAEEIRIVMSYLLRRAETRVAYLDQLAALGQIPLEPSPAESQEIAERLQSSGRSEVEIQRILGFKRSVDEADAE